MLPNDEKSLRQLIAAAVKGGYLVSVFDGGEWALKRSTDEADHTVSPELEALYDASLVKMEE